MTVAFPPEIESFVEHEISAGVYASREELIVAAVGLLRRHQAEYARLQAEINEGLEGEAVPAEAAFATLRAKFSAFVPNDAP